MVKVTIDVDAGRRRLSVRAVSIRKALEAAERRHPGCALEVVFPLDPDTFFVRDVYSGVDPEIAEIAA